MAKFLWKQKQEQFKHKHVALDIRPSCDRSILAQDAVADLASCKSRPNASKNKIHNQICTTSKLSSHIEPKQSKGKERNDEWKQSKSKSACNPAAIVQDTHSQIGDLKALNIKKVLPKLVRRHKPCAEKDKSVNVKSSQQEGVSICDGSTILKTLTKTSDMTLTHNTLKKSGSSASVGQDNCVKLSFCNIVPKAGGNVSFVTMTSLDTTKDTSANGASDSSIKQIKNLMTSSAGTITSQADDKVVTSICTTPDVSVSGNKGSYKKIASEFTAMVIPSANNFVSKAQKNKFTIQPIAAVTEVSEPLQSVATSSHGINSSSNSQWFFGTATKAGSTTSNLRKIPRPCNSFFIFANEFRHKFIQVFPSLNNSEISRKLGSAWRALTVEEKERYYEQARVVAKEHTLRYPNYSYSPHRKYSKGTNSDVSTKDSGNSFGSSYQLSRSRAVPTSTLSRSLCDFGGGDAEINKDNLQLPARKPSVALGGGDVMFGQSTSLVSMMETVTGQISNIMSQSQTQANKASDTVLAVSPRNTAGGETTEELQEHWKLASNFTVSTTEKVVNNKANVTKPARVNFSSIEQLACGDGHCLTNTKDDSQPLSTTICKSNPFDDNILNAAARLFAVPVNCQRQQATLHLTASTKQQQEQKNRKDFAFTQQLICGDGPSTSMTKDDYQSFPEKGCKVNAPDCCMLDTAARLFAVPVGSPHHQAVCNHGHLSQQATVTAPVAISSFKQSEAKKRTAEDAELVQGQGHAVSDRKKHKGRIQMVEAIASVREGLDTSSSGSFSSLQVSHSAIDGPIRPHCINSVNELTNVLATVMKDSALSSIVEAVVGPNGHSKASVLVSLNAACVEELHKVLTTFKGQGLLQRNEIATSCFSGQNGQMARANDETVIKVTTVCKETNTDDLELGAKGQIQCQLKAKVREKDDIFCCSLCDLDLNFLKEYDEVHLDPMSGGDTTAACCCLPSDLDQNHVQISLKLNQEHPTCNSLEDLGNNDKSCSLDTGSVVKEESLILNDLNLKDQIQYQDQGQLGQGDADSATSVSSSSLRRITFHRHLPLPAQPTPVHVMVDEARNSLFH